MFVTLLENALVAALIVAIPTDILLKVAKKFKAPSKFIPLMSILIGIIVSWLMFGFMDRLVVLTGILAGAASCGLYDLVKKTFPSKKGKK